nr:MAG TPA: Endonuclease [Caudoviricetes sp.]
MRRSKYGNRKTMVDGITFDSKKEANRFRELQLLERAGKITALQRQVKYVLIPTQRELSNEIYKKGAHQGHFKPGKVLEKECSYIADFAYIQDGAYVVEDTKGVRTEAYKIKRKLMLERYGIQIREV